MHADPHFSLQLPERHELWWDDGTAEPEWYVDRHVDNPVSNQTAVLQLLSMFTFLGVGVGGVAYMMGDRLNPAASRGEYGFPTDMKIELDRFHPDRASSGQDEEDEDEDDD